MTTLSEKCNMQRSEILHDTTNFALAYPRHVALLQYIFQKRKLWRRARTNLKLFMSARTAMERCKLLIQKPSGSINRTPRPSVPPVRKSRTSHTRNPVLQSPCKVPAPVKFPFDRAPSTTGSKSPAAPRSADGDRVRHSRAEQS